MAQDPNVMNLSIEMSGGERTLKAPTPGGGTLVVNFDDGGVTIQIMGRNGTRVLSTFATSEEIETGRLEQ